jgi:hypothetical protein
MQLGILGRQEGELTSGQLLGYKGGAIPMVADIFGRIANSQVIS